MDELDLLRSDWKKNEQKFTRIPRNELYGMLHKKSSSIVKWILIISILEIAFWVGLSFIPDNGKDKGTQLIDSFNIDPILNAMSWLSYGILVFFCVLIFRAYNRIKVTDNARNLMGNILKVRRTVSYYIYFNLAFLIISTLFLFYEYFNKDAGMVALFDKAEAHGKLSLLGLIAFAISILAIGIIAGIAWLFYRIIYGLLLKKLHHNYEELKKIEDNTSQ